MTNSEILKANGYSIWNTGGGCTAWGKDFENGKSVLIGRDSRHNVDEDAEYDKLKIYVGATIETEQGDFINVESKDNNAEQLIRFVDVLNEMDNDTFQGMVNFQPFISI